jgi:hypothetical protein
MAEFRVGDRVRVSLDERRCVYGDYVDGDEGVVMPSLQSDAVNHPGSVRINFDTRNRCNYMVDKNELKNLTRRNPADALFT